MKNRTPEFFWREEEEPFKYIAPETKIMLLEAEIDRLETMNRLLRSKLRDVIRIKAALKYYCRKELYETEQNEEAERF